MVGSVESKRLEDNFEAVQSTLDRLASDPDAFKNFVREQLAQGHITPQDVFEFWEEYSQVLEAEGKEVSEALAGSVSHEENVELGAYTDSGPFYDEEQALKKTMLS